MTTADVKSLFNIFDGSTATAMKVTDGTFSLELQRGGAIAAVQSAPTSAPSVQPSGETVNAPLVGTYYSAPSPDAPPFVTVGQQVKKGDPLCLIEAMKMMSEVPAPCDCTIQEIFPDNGALLAFDSPILRYQAV